MLTRLMHTLIFAAIGAASAFMILYYLLGQDPVNYSIIGYAAGGMALLGFLFGYEAADTFRGLMKLRD